ncbi:ankyrin repeat domain-containing protein [Aphanothece hegewaldii]
MLDSGYDINTRFEEGITPLRSAAHHGHFEIVKMLVSQ